MDIHKFSVGLLFISLLASAGAWPVAQHVQPAGPVQGKDDGEGNDGEVEIKLADAPAAVQAAVAKLTAAANVKKVIQETDEDITTYEVEFTDNGAACAGTFSTAGDLMELEKATPVDKLPAAALAALKKEYPKATLANPELVTKTYYEVHVVIDGKKHVVKVDAAGGIEDESNGGDEHGNNDGAAEKHAKNEQPEPGEVKVKVEQTPPAVQKTIKSELVGAELEDIAKKQREGKTVYETDIIKNGHKWEIVIGEDGQIISKLQEGSAAEREADKLENGTAKEAGWRESFEVHKSDLAATGNNPWLTMQPGRVLKLRNGVDSLTITILSDTLTVDGVKVGVLEERETKDGKLAEISRNFFATDKKTGDVYYFGEDVDNYKDGKIIDHESAWRAGEKGARFGLMIPGKPKVGDKFYQEIAPKVAMDRVEIVSTDETLKTPAGTFEHCVHLKETTPLDGDVSHKWYAPGVGMVKDDEFELAEKP